VALVGQPTVQLAQALPVAPHAAVAVPGWHVVPPQHPPWQGEAPLQVVEHAPLVQALPVRQSDSVVQPHVPPPRHAAPLEPVHTLHARPPDPQAPGAVPAWQVVPSQQPPLHCPGPEQLELHLPPLHARSAGQSVELEQPHVPAMHALPFGLPMQSTQAEAEPHAAAEVPETHLPAEPPQQKPAPHPPPSQSAVQAPATHVGVSAPHATHAPPNEPHCMSDLPGPHVVPSQHPPLQVRLPAQPVEQRPLDGLHASPGRQSFDVVQPGFVSAGVSERMSAGLSAGASCPLRSLRASTVASRDPPSLPPSLPNSVDRLPNGSAHDTSSAPTPRTAAAASKDQRTRVIGPPRTA